MLRCAIMLWFGLSILSFVGFAVLIGLGILAGEGAAGTTVQGCCKVGKKK
jgi:hypothetical protein